MTAVETPPRKVTDVAVGILIREDGFVLYGQRPEGKPYAGWWEFPGGKREQGEPMLETLKRELLEELGIEVLEAKHWVTRDHVYEHATVRLFFYQVTRWNGTPHSREGQRLEWCSKHDHHLHPVLPAALPVIEWFKLPDHIQVPNQLIKSALSAQTNANAGPDELEPIELIFQGHRYGVCTSLDQVQFVAKAGYSGPCEALIVNPKLAESIGDSARLPLYIQIFA
jgi:8-oxo-dGTP diphosphatase